MGVLFLLVFDWIKKHGHGHEALEAHKNKVGLCVSSTRLMEDFISWLRGISDVSVFSSVFAFFLSIVAFPEVHFL